MLWVFLIVIRLARVCDVSNQCYPSVQAAMPLQYGLDIDRDYLVDTLFWYALAIIFTCKTFAQDKQNSPHTVLADHLSGKIVSAHFAWTLNGSSNSSGLYC